MNRDEIGDSSAASIVRITWTLTFDSGGSVVVTIDNVVRCITILIQFLSAENRRQQEAEEQGPYALVMPFRSLLHASHLACPLLLMVDVETSNIDFVLCFS